MLTTSNRLSALVALTVLIWLMVTVVPGSASLLLTPSTQRNGDSPYTMFERCHPAQFNIPTTTVC